MLVITYNIVRSACREDKIKNAPLKYCKIKLEDVRNKLSNLWERILVPISRQLGNLKKTYLSCRCLKIGTFKHRHTLACSNVEGYLDRKAGKTTSRWDIPYSGFTPGTPVFAHFTSAWQRYMIESIYKRTH